MEELGQAEQAELSGAQLSSGLGYYFVYIEEKGPMLRPLVELNQ